MKTVYVGLSGGVDSAVSAYLLKQEGYHVVGVFIKGWEPDFLPCTGAEDRLSAMRVAAHLQIPFVTYDLAEEYKKSVVDYFISEYQAGHTPNPDVMCNRPIKFGAMWARAKADGADYVATGHYAQTDGVHLLTSKDADKDQTYFLNTLTKEDLAHVLFPIGKYKKSEVRTIAERAKLPNFARPDSQGLCFLGHVDMHEFLKRFIPGTVGRIVDTTGAPIGEHDGAVFYTIGQAVAVAGSPTRKFVINKDSTANTLVVADKPRAADGRKVLTLRTTSWVSGSAPTEPFLAQYRYHGPVVKARIEGDTVTLAEPILVADGQSLVAYSADGSICLGGGIIG